MNLEILEKKPITISLITTFKCTASCVNCCFHCTPKALRMMSFSEICKYIDECLSVYSSIKVLVFTGGECTLLGDDLFKSIRYATNKGLLTRIVTNGWWAKNPVCTTTFLNKLKQSGLKEINFSTGDEHQEWVSFDNVRNASLEAIKLGLGCAINVETHDDSTFSIENVLKNDGIFADYCSFDVKKGKIFIEKGVWAKMNLRDKADITYNKFRTESVKDRCKHLFSTIPINAYGEVLSCCGITSEINPFLRIGNFHKEKINNIYRKSFKDIIKLWIYTEGPSSILSYIYKKAGKNKEVPSAHMCVLCREIFMNEGNLSILQDNYNDFYSRILLKYLINK